MTGKAAAVDIDGERYLNAAQAAAMLGVKPATLYAYASRGRLRSFKRGIGRRSFYRYEDLLALVAIRPGRVPDSAIPKAEDWVPFTG